MQESKAMLLTTGSAPRNARATAAIAQHRSFALTHVGAIAIVAVALVVITLLLHLGWLPLVLLIAGAIAVVAASVFVAIRTRFQWCTPGSISQARTCGQSSLILA
jgi:uncharacterized membrane protein